jgi:anthranilate synthase component 1
MSQFPEFEVFCNEAKKSLDAIPIARRLLSDSLTPVSAFRRLDDGGQACLFESVVGGEQVGRYSFLAFHPTKTLIARQRNVAIRVPNEEDVQIESDNPLEIVREHIDAVKVQHREKLPPFIGGAIGYVGYDAIRYVENLPNAPDDDRGLPDVALGFYDTMVVFDNITKTIYVISLAWLNQGDELRAAYDKAVERIDNVIQRLDGTESDLDFAEVPAEGVPLEPKANMTREDFHDAVHQCVEYIRAGDIFQVVLSQRLEVDLTCQPFELYRSLRVLNPSPFMFFVRTDEVTLVGSSPEIMCRVVDGKMTVRPLAGTRKRGETDEEDRALEQELLADPKERAEHVMLVDLGRNDVGRVAQFGSVAMPDLMVVERYSHVMHISSTVTGQLRPEFDAFDALMASLPAGTVSGAPKVRAMEIIDQFEPTRRGPYAGAVGYFDYSNNMDTCIALRTMVIQDDKIYVQAGAGIVADSDPESEYQETLNKARGLIKAIEMTAARVKPDAQD